MTDEELKALVASLAISQKETDRQLKETGTRLKELGEQADKRLQETDIRLKELGEQTDRQLKETGTRLNELGEQADKRLQQTETRLNELGEQADKRLQETHQQLNELGKQIGGLGNKFGGFTEGLALPSMRRILEEDFGMDTISPRLRRRINGEVLEVDVLGYTNSQINTAYVVEVKSRLNAQAIQQMLHTLKEFSHFFPEHRDKILYGILAFVDFREDFLTQAEQSGLYLAHIHDDLFELKSSPDFQPRNFQ